MKAFISVVAVVLFISSHPLLAQTKNSTSPGSMRGSILDELDDIKKSLDGQKPTALECQLAGGGAYKKPHIELVQSGNPATTGPLRLVGYVEGVCIADAGLFQGGRKILDIKVSMKPSFQRFEFQLLVAPGRQRELRAYDNQGQVTALTIPDTDRSDDPLGIGVPRPRESDDGMASF